MPSYSCPGCGLQVQSKQEVRARACPECGQELAPVPRAEETRRQRLLQAGESVEEATLRRQKQRRFRRRLAFVALLVVFIYGWLLTASLTGALVVTLATAVGYRALRFAFGVSWTAGTILTLLALAGVSIAGFIWSTFLK